MKRCMQTMIIIACSLILSNLEAAHDNKKTIFIKGMGNDDSTLVVSIECNDATTIKEIKKSIYAAKNIPVAYQALFKVNMIRSPFSIYAMRAYKELEDDRTCGSYNIESKMILQLSLIKSISPLP